MWDKIFVIVLVVLFVGLILFSFLRKRKYNSELSEMRKDLKIGDKVMTDTGMVGTLVDTFEEEGYQYFVLKSGAGAHVGYFTVHANAIYYVYGKDKEEKKPNLGIKQKDEKADTKTEETNVDAGKQNTKPDAIEGAAAEQQTTGEQQLEDAAQKPEQGKEQGNNQVEKAKGKKASKAGSKGGNKAKRVSSKSKK